MHIKPQFFFWPIMLLSFFLILPGCMSVSGSQNAIQSTDTAIFSNKRIAILPVKMQTSLAPDSVMALRTEVSKRLAPALQAKIPSAAIINITDTADRLNQTNSLTTFEQLISSYENTGVMDKRHVIALGQTLGCDFLLFPRIKSEKLDIGFIAKGTGASLDVMLINTTTSEISWAGSGEWKKGGVFGQGGAAYSELAENIIKPAFESLQSNGATATTTTTTTTTTKETPVTNQTTTSRKKKASKQVVMQVQQQLLALGYEPGPADGKLGQGSVKAIRKFQKENNLAETGQADKDTISKLAQKTKEQSIQPTAQTNSVTPPSLQTEKIAPSPSNTSPLKTEPSEQKIVPATSVASPMDL